MKGWPVYQDIQQLKERGLNKSQVERQLGINWKTVNYYWEMTAEEFAERQKRAKKRRKNLEPYKDTILDWLHKYPDYLVLRFMTGLRSITVINTRERSERLDDTSVIYDRSIIFQKVKNSVNTKQFRNYRRGSRHR